MEDDFREPKFKEKEKESIDKSGAPSYLNRCERIKEISKLHLIGVVSEKKTYINELFKL